MSVLTSIGLIRVQESELLICMLKIRILYEHKQNITNVLNRFRLSTFPVDDYDTSVVRIEKSRMQKLGIQEEDTVKISGAQSTGAICLSVDDGYVIQNDSEITYLNDDPVILPRIRAAILYYKTSTATGRDSFR